MSGPLFNHVKPLNELDIQAAMPTNGGLIQLTGRGWLDVRQAVALRDWLNGVLPATSGEKS